MKKHLHCCFIDNTKASDTVNRLNSWYKIAFIAISGQLLNILKKYVN